MSFHFGKPILVMLVLAVTGGVAAGALPDRSQKADLTVWVFGRAARPDYAATATTTAHRAWSNSTAGARARRVDVKLLSTRAEDVPPGVDVHVRLAGRARRGGDRDQQRRQVLSPADGRDRPAPAQRAI